MTSPAPQGLYVAATRHGDLIFTAGMTPRLDGVLESVGPVAIDADPEHYRDAVTLAARNALSAARARLMDGERLAAILSMTVYVATEPGFTAHSRLADFASEFLRAELGAHGVGSRAAVGVLSLPGNAPVEIQLVASV